MGTKTVRIRRVGSVTFGMVLVVMGILFLVHIFFPAVTIYSVYRFWPVILILLGFEVLAGSRQKTYEVLDSTGSVIEQSKVVYDIAAIVMMMVLTGFAMCMAIIDYAYEKGGYIIF